MYEGVNPVEANVYTSASAPVDGTTAVHTVTLAASVNGGTFTLVFAGANSVNGGETAAINYNDNAAAVQAKLEAVLGTGNVVCANTLAAGMTLTYAGPLAKLAYPVPKVNVNTTTVTGVAAAAPTVAETTPGVSATLRGSTPGANFVFDLGGKDMWVDRGTANAPNWCPVSRIWQNAGAPVNGTTFANKAAIGDLLIDTTNKKVYTNTNTLASPTWTVVGTQT